MKYKQILGIIAILVLLVIPLGLARPRELKEDTIACSRGMGYTLDACVDGNEFPSLEGMYCLCYDGDGFNCEMVDGEDYGCNLI